MNFTTSTYGPSTAKPGGILPTVGYTGRLRPNGVPFPSSQYIKGRGNCHFSIRKGHTVSCKAEEMVAKAKHIKGCHILAEMTTQLNQNDRKPGKNVAIIGNSIVLVFPGGIRKGCNFDMRGVPFW